MPKPNPYRTITHSPDLTGPVRALPWADRALCAEVDPELFFSQASARYEHTADGERESMAKAICRRCPVIRQCREYAMSRPELEGIWGAMTEKDRRQARKAAS